MRILQLFLIFIAIHAQIRSIITLAPTTFQALMPYPARLINFDPLTKKKWPERLKANFNNNRNLGLNFNKNRPELKFIGQKDFSGFYTLCQKNSEELLERFPFSLTKTEKNEIIINGLDAKTDGNTLFTFMLQELALKENIQANNSHLVFAINDIDIQKYQYDIADACERIKVKLHAIVPKSTALVMRQEEIGRIDASLVVTITTNGNNTSLDFYQITREFPLQDDENTKEPDSKLDEDENIKVDSEDKQNGKENTEKVEDPENDPKKESTKKNKKSKKKKNKKKKAEPERKTEIKHIHNAQIPNFSDDIIKNLYKEFIKRTVEKNVSELRKKKGESEKCDVVAWPFDDKNVCKTFFFDSTELLTEMPFQLVNYRNWYKNSKENETFTEESHENARFYEKHGIDIFTAENRLKYGLNTVKFDLHELQNEIDRFMETVDSKKIEKEFLKTAVDRLNIPEITCENVTEHLNVFALHSHLTDTLFDRLILTARSFDKTWGKGGNCLLIYEVDDPRIIIYDQNYKKILPVKESEKSEKKEKPDSDKIKKTEKFLAKSRENYRNLSEELAARSSAKDLARKIKTDVDISKVKWQEYSDLLEIKQKILENTAKLSEIQLFIEKFVGTKYKYETLPKSLPDLENILKECKSKMNKDPDLATLLNDIFTDTNTYFAEITAQEEIPYDTYFELQKRGKTLSLEIRSNEKMLKDRREKLKNKKLLEQKAKEQEEKKLKELEEEKLKESEDVKDSEKLEPQDADKVFELKDPDQKKEPIKESIKEIEEVSETGSEYEHASQKAQDEKLDRIEQKLKEEVKEPQREEKKSVFDIFTSLFSKKNEESLSTSDFQDQLHSLHKKIKNIPPHLENTFKDSLQALEQSVKHSLKNIPEDEMKRKEMVEKVNMEYEKMMNEEEERAEL